MLAALVAQASSSWSGNTMNIKKIEGHDKRKRRERGWVAIIIHHTGVGGREEISDDLWSKLYKNITNYLARKDKAYVSAHYTISREGEITEVIDPDKYESWHAGKSSSWSRFHRRVVSDWNRYSIGIELIGDGNLHVYSEKQYQALASLCKMLKKKWPSIMDIKGHEEIAPKRKNDPGMLFDWDKLLRYIYVS